MEDAMWMGRRKITIQTPSGTGKVGNGTCQPPSEIAHADLLGAYRKDSDEEGPWKTHKQKLETGSVEKPAPKRAHTNHVSLGKEWKGN